MEGWDVVTNDDEKVGRVVAVRGDWLIVEHGTLMKARNPLPKTFASVREDCTQVCVNLPKNMIYDAPKVDDPDAFDEQAAALHYGLAGGWDQAPAEGYGDMDPDDPAYGLERDAAAAGMLPPEQQRALIRKHARGHTSKPPSPGLLGGRD